MGEQDSFFEENKSPAPKVVVPGKMGKHKSYEVKQTANVLAQHGDKFQGGKIQVKGLF